MVGYDPKQEKALTYTQYGIAGAVSAAMSRVVVQPLDVVKIRFQLQVEPISRGSSTSKYKGIVQAFSTIVKEEGVQALWKGHVPAQALSVVYGMSQFVFFETITKKVWTLMPSVEGHRHVVHLFCGGASACMATCVAMPVDVLRTRLIAQGQLKVYHGIAHAVKHMYQNEGILAFYKGLTPTLIQIAPYMGIQFAAYSFLKMVTIQWQQSDSEEMKAVASILCGGCSGATAKLSTYPFEVLKKRLQVQGFEVARKPFGYVEAYQGMLDCMRKIWMREGFLSFYKGLSPSLLKATVSSGLQFFLYEEACIFMETYTT